MNLIVGDFNLDCKKRKENSYQHRKIYDDWLEAITAFDFVQIVKNPCGKVFTTVFKRLSIIDHVYVDDMSAVETITVEKQPISDLFLVCVTSIGKAKMTKFSDIEYQCWKNYYLQKIERRS